MMQPNRVLEVKRRAGQRAAAAGLDEQFGVKLYELIIAEACALEDRIIDHSTPVTRRLESILRPFLQ